MAYTVEEMDLPKIGEKSQRIEEMDLPAQKITTPKATPQKPAPTLPQSEWQKGLRGAVAHLKSTGMSDEDIKSGLSALAPVDLYNLAAHGASWLANKINPGGNYEPKLVSSGEYALPGEHEADTLAGRAKQGAAGAVLGDLSLAGVAKIGQKAAGVAGGIPSPLQGVFKGAEKGLGVVGAITPYRAGIDAAFGGAGSLAKDTARALTGTAKPGEHSPWIDIPSEIMGGLGGLGAVGVARKAAPAIASLVGARKPAEAILRPMAENEAAQRLHRELDTLSTAERDAAIQAAKTGVPGVTLAPAQTFGFDSLKALRQNLVDRYKGQGTGTEIQNLANLEALQHAKNTNAIKLALTSMGVRADDAIRTAAKEIGAQQIAPKQQAVKSAENAAKRAQVAVEQHIIPEPVAPKGEFAGPKTVMAPAEANKALYDKAVAKEKADFAPFDKKYKEFTENGTEYPSKDLTTDFKNLKEKYQNNFQGDVMPTTGTKAEALIFSAADANTSKLTIGQLVEMRKALNRVSSGSNMESNYIKQAKGIVDKHLEKSMEGTGDFAKLQELNKEFGSVAAKWRDTISSDGKYVPNIMSRVLNSDPYIAGDILLNNPGTSGVRVGQQVKAALGDNIPELKPIVENHIAKTAAENAEMDIGSLLKQQKENGIGPLVEQIPSAKVHLTKLVEEAKGQHATAQSAAVEKTAEAAQELERLKTARNLQEANIAPQKAALASEEQAIANSPIGTAATEPYGAVQKLLTTPETTALNAAGETIPAVKLGANEVKRLAEKSPEAAEGLKRIMGELASNKMVQSGKVNPEAFSEFMDKNRTTLENHFSPEEMRVMDEAHTAAKYLDDAKSVSPAQFAAASSKLENAVLHATGAISPRVYHAIRSGDVLGTGSQLFRNEATDLALLKGLSDPVETERLLENYGRYPGAIERNVVPSALQEMRGYLGPKEDQERPQGGLPGETGF